MMSFARFRKIEDKFVVTNDVGKYVFLTDNELAKFIAGKIRKGSDLYNRLKELHFIIDDGKIDEAARIYAQKNSFLGLGPVLHIMILTLRCNEICSYCHASRAPMDKTEYDMSVPTAEKVVDLIFQSPTDTLTIEFQGGEPLANFDTLKHVVSYANEKNKTARKNISFSLVSNLSLLDEEKFNFLIENRIQICTSLDGPEELHDKNRKYSGGSAYKETILWMDRINKKYAEIGLDPVLYHVEALLTVTRHHFPHYKEIVEEYLSHGCKAIFIRPLNPFGFAKNTFSKIGYTGGEFIEFYLKTLDYIIQRNREGAEILERFAAIFLTKIFTEYDPNYLDIRSPCGAGIGQIAYNYDGSIFTCDEGRMVYQMGDDSFIIGHSDNAKYGELVTHETVKSIAVASCLDSIPFCCDCAYKPYCGTCPVYNYTEQGSIFARMPQNEKCKIHMGIMDHLFRVLKDGDEQTRAILERWTQVKERTAFYQRV